jgi:mycothiol system anti-sigma-R factor
MADCNETLKELDRFLDNELASEAISDLSVHLEGCVDCQQTFEFHVELRNIVKLSAKQEPLPQSLLSKIKDCFGTELDS